MSLGRSARRGAARAAAIALTVWLAVGSLGCGGTGAFGGLSATFPDNQPDDIAAVLQRLRSAPERATTPVVVGAAEGELFVYDLIEENIRWRRPAQLDGTPFVAGDYVVSKEAGQVIVRSLENGSQLLSVAVGELHLVGADGEGANAAISLSTGGGVGATSRLIVLRGGLTAWDLDAPQPFGAPAFEADMVLLPWANQNLSVFDGTNGREIARIRLDDVLGSARSADGRVYFGENNIFRLDEAVAAGLRDDATQLTVNLPDALPGNPALFGRAYTPPGGTRSATHRIRLEWRPDDERVGRDQVYLVFYRLVFCLDASDGGVRWAYTHERDIVGAAATETGLLVADTDGDVIQLEPSTGAPNQVVSMDVEPESVRWSVGAYIRPANGGTRPPVDEQLLETALLADARLGPAQSFAVRALARRPEEAVTLHLVALCEARAGSASRREAACEALGGRSVAPEAMLDALSRRARFLEGTTAPPVGPLATAVASVGEVRAVPLLVDHLRDPNTREGELIALISALATLGDRSATEPVRDFLRLYHADEPSEALIAALKAAIDALVTLEGPAATDTLEEIGADPMGIADVQTHAQQQLATLTAPEEAPAAGETDEQEAEVEMDLTNELPERITGEIVAEVLAPVDRDLRQCLNEAPGFPMSARVVLALDGEGTIETISAIPAAVQECVAPLVQSQTFPGNRQRRHQRVTFTIRRR